MDEAIGNVTYAMKAAKMWTNSVFVISNDNGGWLGYGGLNCEHLTFVTCVCFLSKNLGESPI